MAPVSLVFIFLAGDIVFQIEDYVSGSANIGMRLGIGAAVVMISLVGGRVVPSFTRNWLVRENPGRLPASFGRFDSSIVAVSALTVSLWAFCPDWKGTALLALISGLGQLVRLGRWAGNRAWRDRLVLVLHIGYAFVPLGFLLLGASILFPATVPVSGAVHAWTAGAIGTMTLAIMTRASLGHTGRPLSADWITHVIYGLVILAALFRIAAAFSVQIASFLLYLAGGLWIAGFWLFALSYGPLLCRPRIRPRS